MISAKSTEQLYFLTLNQASWLQKSAAKLYEVTLVFKVFAQSDT